MLGYLCGILHVNTLELQPNKQTTNSEALVREPTIPTDRPPLVGEVSADFCR
jgi:hypothetical protein